MPKRLKCVVLLFLLPPPLCHTCYFHTTQGQTPGYSTHALCICFAYASRVKTGSNATANVLSNLAKAAEPRLVTHRGGKSLDRRHAGARHGKRTSRQCLRPEARYIGPAHPPPRKFPFPWEIWTIIYNKRFRGPAHTSRSVHPLSHSSLA